MKKNNILSTFNDNLLKMAGKNKVGRKKILKSLEKAKTDYSKTKSELDKVSKELEKIQKTFDILQSKCSEHKKEMIKFHKIVQKMDLSGASDAVFYKDQNDISYVINGKEFDLSLSDDGDLEKMPWREARRARRSEINLDESDVPSLADDGDEESSSQNEEGSFNFNLDDTDDLSQEIDELYNQLVD